MKQLLLGAGSRHLRILPRDLSDSDHVVPLGITQWEDLTTLDNNKDHAPDCLWDLECGIELPWEADTFDELHAYEVLEHTGTQGDYNFFFWQWSDFWRVLKPDAHFYGSVPRHDSIWALGDPSHKRIIPYESFQFLNQANYVKQVGNTAMSDFRYLYKADFEVEDLFLAEESLFFTLRAVKPSRCDV